MYRKLGGTLKPSKYALDAIRPTWGGTSNRVLSPAVPAALPLPGREIAAALDAVAGWVDEQHGVAPAAWIAGQSAAACREIAALARQDNPELSDHGTTALLRDLFPDYDVGFAAGLWVAFPIADAACVITAGTPHRLAVAILADEAARRS